MSAAGHRLGVLFATLGAVGFSFKAILIKLAYPYGVDAVTLLALRMGFSLPFFVAIGWADARRRQPAALGGRDVLLLLGLGSRLVPAVAAAHAPISETIQHFFLSQRAGDVWDVAADWVGVALGVLLVRALLALAGRRLAH